MIEFVAVGSWRAERGEHAPPHRHAAWKITHYRSGRIDSIVDGHRHRTAPGTVLVLPPDASHAEVARTAYRNDYLLLRAPLDQPWPARCDGSDADLVGALLAALVRLRAGGDEAADRDLRTQLITTVDLVLRRRLDQNRPDRDDALVREVEQLFETEHAAPLAMTDVAARMGVSPSTLRLQFRRHRQVSPQQALRTARTRRALDLLHTSDLTLDAVALRCGFHSASHLSRVVKEHTGLSPGAVRRSGKATSR